MKHFIIIMITLLSHACNMERRLTRYCLYCHRETTHSDSIEIRSTTEVIKKPVYIIKPTDSLLLKALAKCDSANRAQMPITVMETGKQKITVSIQDGRVEAKSECKEDSLRIELNHTKELVEKIKTGKKIIKLPPEQILVYPAKFFYWWFGATALTLLIIATYVILKLRSRITRT